MRPLFFCVLDRHPCAHNSGRRSCEPKKVQIQTLRPLDPHAHFGCSHSVCFGSAPMMSGGAQGRLALSTVDSPTPSLTTRASDCLGAESALEDSRGSGSPLPWGEAPGGPRPDPGSLPLRDLGGRRSGGNTRPVGPLPSTPAPGGNPALPPLPLPDPPGKGGKGGEARFWAQTPTFGPNLREKYRFWPKSAQI